MLPIITACISSSYLVVKRDKLVQGETRLQLNNPYIIRLIAESFSTSYEWETSLTFTDLDRFDAVLQLSVLNPCPVALFLFYFSFN